VLSWLVTDTMEACIRAAQRAQMQGMIAKTQLWFERWDDVPVFLALYRQRTLAGAAAVLGLDASTMSRRLAALERSLRLTLFERTRDGLEPTESADLLLAPAEEMEGAHARLGGALSGIERAAEGVVRLSVAPGLAEAFVVPALAELRRAQPGIVVELEVSTSVANLTRREADVALRTIRPQAPSLVLKKLASSRWVPMANASLAKKLRCVRSLDALPWVVWDASLSMIPPAQWLRRALGDRGRPALVTSHFASQLAALEAGMGVALVPDAYVRVYPWLRAIDVHDSLAPLMQALPVDDLWLVGHSALRRVPRVDVVWRAIERAFTAEEQRAARPRREARGSGATASARPASKRA
jgi:DNA-binding transcriptional LysR family regulator